MQRNPAADWTIDDVGAVCHEHGLLCSPPRGGGSHFKISHPSERRIVTIPTGSRLNRSIFASSLHSFSPYEPQMTRLEYSVVIEPLSLEDGGGFLATVPDLPGCMSDGETPEEAVTNVQDAIAAWLEAARDLGREIPKPSRRAA
jgi:predicted RNase H-like HicB family nuclease